MTAEHIQTTQAITLLKLCLEFAQKAARAEEIECNHYADAQEQAGRICNYIEEIKDLKKTVASQSLKIQELDRQNAMLSDQESKLRETVSEYAKRMAYLESALHEARNPDPDVD